MPESPLDAKNTIGKVADLLNLSTETIRKYQKKGIVILETDEETGYRYFDLPTINKLLRFQFYKKSGFNGNEAYNLLNMETEKCIPDFLDKRIEQLEEEIRINKLKIIRLNELKTLMNSIDLYLDKVTERELPDFYYVDYYRNNELSMGNKKKLHRMIECMPFATPAPMFRKEKMDELEYGLIAEKKYLEGQNLDGIEHFHNRKALYMIIKNEQGNSFTFRNIHLITEYAEEHELELECILGRTILSRSNLDLSVCFHELWGIIK